MPGRIIEVTQELIDQAKVADSSHCMIAEAIKVAMPTARGISVDLATIRYTDQKQKKRFVILTPPSAQQHLLWFDQADDRLQPFKFKLPPAAQTVRATVRGRKVQESLPGMPEKHGKARLRSRSVRVPMKVGGKLPPIGALAGGAPAEASVTATARHAGRDRVEVRRGRIRTYGLREMAVE